MKPPRLLLLSASLLIIFSYLSCKKSDNPDQNNGYKTEYITTTVSGRVTDADNKPVSGALVKAGYSTAKTDIDGAFNLTNVNVDKNAALVKVEKEGFFLGTKTIIPSVKNNNQVAIRLIKKTVSGNISAETGGAVTVQSNGGSIIFETNSFVNPSGNTAYTGTVAVSAFFINPEAPDFNDIMPGTLRGITSANQETGLQSFGMMAVELTGTGGEKLQLAPGKTAILHFPIPPSLQGEAPATIPLWSLDESTGLWKEEGHATKQGTEYIGNVSHFSFWNCDAPFPVIDFTGIIHDQHGNNIAGADVVISIPPGGSTAGTVSGTGLTNADGIITGKLPANKVLQLKIYNKCRDLLHTQSIGPFSTSADLGVITVNSSSSQVVISGSVKDCFNAPLTTGFISIKLDNLYYNVPVANGNFTATIDRCNNETVTATLIAYNQAQQASGQEVNISVSSGTVNAGTLTACGSTADTYLRYTLDGTNYQLLSPADSFYHFTGGTNNTITYIGGFRQGQAVEELVIMFTGPLAPGPHNGFISDFYFGGPALHWMASDRFNVDVTEYGTGPGGYVMGTFSGIVRDSAGTKTAPLNCSFRVKKQL
jgi:hypothetical protein